MGNLGIFGRYRLMRPLAQGGMAEVFLARQEGPVGFQKVVVVKRVLPHLAKDAELIQMFLDEARLGARLSHPNVVQVFDFGEIEGSYFLAMEYLAGEDVSAVISRARAAGKLPPPQIAAIVGAAACEGLGYVHALADDEGRPLGVVHRDVSPSNLLVTYQGAVKLLDFGIAKAEGKSQKTRAGTLKGKTSYMSPEQVEGKPLDGRSDLFALGAVLYEILTGVRLFARENEVAAARAIADDHITPPSQRRRDLPGELDAVIMKALARPLGERFQTAAEMRAELDTFLASRTYVPAAGQLRDYLLLLFGEQHVLERSRAPVTDPSGSGGAAPSGSGKSPRSADATVPSVRRPSRRRRSRRFWRIARWAGSGAAAVAAMVVVAMVIPGRSTPSAPLFDPTSQVRGGNLAPAPSPALASPPAPPAPALAPPAPSSTQTALAPPRRGEGERQRSPAGKVAGHAPRLRHPGALAVNCLPWCRVYVDGRDTGKSSPATDIHLSAGRHVLTVVNPPSGRKEQRPIEIVQGQTLVENVLF